LNQSTGQQHTESKW